MRIEFKPSPKQHLMFKLFDDATSTEILFGGSVGSAKSYGICALIILKCLQHPGIRVGLAREHLTVLKKTTMTSFFEVIQNWGLEHDTHYRYNSQSGEVNFTNGSVVQLVELAFNPSDPQYTRLGGALFTFGVIDEAGETDEKGKEIFQTRIGRWKNSELGIKPVLLMTCNPARNFLYRDFYIPFKENRLPDYRKFVQALPEDNPYLSPGYIENLSRTLSLNERRRLLGGEWEVQDDTDALFTQDDINSLFDLSVQFSGDKTPRISADIAFTSDRCVFIVWEGLRVLKIVIKNDSGTVIDTLKNLAQQYRVRPDNISFDSDGVGLYLREHFPSAKEIHNGAKPKKNDGYKNLKTELFFRLSEVSKSGDLKLIDQSFRKEVEEELSCIRHKPRHTMNSIELISKADMKRVLGKSPDIADALAYGMIFHLTSHTMSSDDIIFLDI